MSGVNCFILFTWNLLMSNRSTQKEIPIRLFKNPNKNQLDE